MRFRTVAVATLWAAFFVSTFMALRAADPKSKAKNEEAAAPSPGTVKFTAAPPAVQKTFAVESKNSPIELLGKSDDGNFYMAKVGIGTPTYNYRIAVSKDGQLLEKVLEPFNVEVKLEECPAPVQKALRDEVKGAKFKSGAKVSAAKQIEFILVANQPSTDVDYQLVFTDEGTLLSKMLYVSDDDNALPSPAGPNGKPDAPAKKAK